MLFIIQFQHTHYQMIFRRLLMLPRFCFANQPLQSVEGHKPPALSDTPSGRYAGSLFSAASKSSALQTMANDLTHLKSILKESPTFKEVLKNSAVRRNKQKEIFETFAPQNYNELTINFINSMIEAGRLPQLQKTIKTYLNYCKILNKEEDIRVISAKELNQNEKDKVIASLKKNKPGLQFKVTYEIDPSILGGLQIFAGSEFLDGSFRSRIERLKSELSKMA